MTDRDLLMLAIGVSLAGQETADLSGTEFGSLCDAIKKAKSGDTEAVFEIDRFLSSLRITRTGKVTSSIVRSANELARYHRAMEWMRSHFKLALRPVGTRSQVISFMEGLGFECEPLLPKHQGGSGEVASGTAQ